MGEDQRMNDYAAALEGVARAAEAASKPLSKMADAIANIKLTRAVRLHPSASPIRVPIWVKVGF